MGVAQMIKRVAYPSSFRVQIVSEKIVKPSSPTPKNLRHYKLSFLDQLWRSQYMPLTLFYPNAPTSTLSPSSSSSSILLSATLEKSLAKTLSYYYPCAGKLVDNSHVDCNDTGILFKEVRVEDTMSDTLTKKFSMVQETLFPQQALPWADPIKGGNLAAAQLTHFDCGGVAVSLSLSHKLSDGFTFLKMFNDWAKLARNSTLLTNPPSLIGSTILQPKDDPFTPNLYVVGTNHDLSVVRLRFGSESIKRLQQKVSVESDVKNPTRYEVVSALVNKCAAMAAKDDNNPSSTSFPFTIYMPMNIRKLVTPPVPNYFGNFLSYMLIKISGEDDLKLPNLVSKIRNEKVKHWEKFKGKNEDEILAEIAKEEKGFPKDSSIRQTTSLCGYTLYDIDFGWGKPARATLGAIHEENVFVLMDTPEKGGIDVFGAFDESVAFRFKNDKDVLEFASVDLSY